VFSVPALTPSLHGPGKGKIAVRAHTDASLQPDGKPGGNAKGGGNAQAGSNGKAGGNAKGAGNAKAGSNAKADGNSKGAGNGKAGGTGKAKGGGGAQGGTRESAKPSSNYLIYDSVTPSEIPGDPAIATYANGNYAISAAAVASRGSVLWIDTNGSDPSASVLDVEPGDATPATAAQWTWHKLSADPDGIAILYTMRSEWGATEAAIGTLPGAMQSRVRWWIADPTGVEHLVSGSSATQWYWGQNYDISTATPNLDS
jgi:hypothetical protein